MAFYPPFGCYKNNFYSSENPLAKMIRRKCLVLSKTTQENIQEINLIDGKGLFVVITYFYGFLWTTFSNNPMP